MGASKTVPPASTREETSSLQGAQNSEQKDTHDRCCAKPMAKLTDHSSELPHHVISPRLIQKWHRQPSSCQIEGLRVGRPRRSTSKLHNGRVSRSSASRTTSPEPHGHKRHAHFGPRAPRTATTSPASSCLAPGCRSATRMTNRGFGTIRSATRAFRSSLRKNIPLTGWRPEMAPCRRVPNIRCWHRSDNLWKADDPVYGRHHDETGAAAGPPSRPLREILGVDGSTLRPPLQQRKL